MTNIRRIQGRSLGYILYTDEQTTLGFTHGAGMICCIQQPFIPHFSLPKSPDFIGETVCPTYPGTANPIPLCLVSRPSL